MGITSPLLRSGIAPCSSCLLVFVHSAILRIVRIPVYSAMAIMTMSAAAVLSHGLNAFCDGLRSQQIQTTNYE